MTDDTNKSKTQLIAELHELRAKALEISTQEAFLLQEPGNTPAEKKFEKTGHDPSKRARELECLYNLSRLIETPDISLQEILQKTVTLLPPAWQYPELAYARLVWGRQVFQTAGFLETSLRQACAIQVHGEEAGTLEVTYLGIPPSVTESPFLAEEERLLAALTERLGRVIEYMLARETLQTSETRYRAFFDYGPDGVVTLDTETGRIIEFNEQVCRQLGYTRDEMAQLRIFDIEVTETEAEIQNHIQCILREGRDDFETQHKTKQGELRDVHVTAQVILVGGQPIYHCIWRDITEHKKAEQALEEAHKRLNFHIENSPLAEIEWDGDFHIIRWDGQSEHVFGWTAEEVLGKRIDEVDCIYEGDRANVEAVMADMLSGKRPANISRNRNLRKDGAVIHCEWYNTSIRDGSGRLLSIFSRVLDVTERQQAEEALRESEKRFRSLFEQMLNGLSYCRMIYEEGKPPDFVYLAVNDAFSALTGLKDVIGKRVSEIIPGIQETDPWLIETYARVASTGEPERFETFLTALNMWFAVSVYSPRQDHFVAVFDVITERKRAEEALRESEERLALAQRSSGAGVWDWDLVNDHADWSQELFALFGIDPEQTPSSVAAWRQIIHPEDREAATSRIEQAIAAGNTLVNEYRIILPNGQIRWINALGNTSYDESGRPLRMAGICIDITERKRLEEQLRQAQKMEAVGQLAGGVAHDFNNLLQVILSNADLIQSELPPDAPIRESIDEVLKASQRAADLVRQLLAFSRRQTIQPVYVDLNELIQGMLKMICRVIGEHIELHFIAGAGLAYVLVDKGQMEQVLMNLCVNARDAMARGGKMAIQTQNVSLDAEFCRDNPWASEGRYVNMSVSDTGHGMETETIGHLFEPFFTTKGLGEGTGLGLATVYGIIKQHQGLIHVESEPGAGTVFKVYLPAAVRPEETPETPAKTPVVGGKETILVAEDESAVLKMTERMLASAGYTVLTASNGQEALHLFKERVNDISLVVLDVMMPGLSGKQVMDRIVKEHPDMRFLFCSGYSEDAIHSDFVVEKGLCLIEKPYHKDELLREVRRILDESRDK